MENLLAFEDVKGYRVNIYPHKEKFTCSVCENFILLPPVLLNPQIGFICGVCFQFRKHFLKENDIVLPQKLYEEFALWMRFPCEFCESFTFFNAPGNSHEVQCKKRLFPCPLSKVNRWFIGKKRPCNWKDCDGKSMVSHVKDNHKENILHSPFELRLGDLQNEEPQIYVAILTNRQIISITSEYDKGRNCVVLRCRSNKPGHPLMNHQCGIEMRYSDSKVEFLTTDVYPLGARILERGLATCSIWMDESRRKSLLRFNFEPSTQEGGPMKTDADDALADHDYWC